MDELLALALLSPIAPTPKLGAGGEGGQEGQWQDPGAGRGYGEPAPGLLEGCPPQLLVSHLVA